MSISINWGTKVISVPKVDTTLVQPSPEVRSLDINVFRLALKDLEDDEAGISYDKTHNHNTEVSLSGVTLARVIELINGYTVTFEDGQYAVNLVGANSNIAENTNVNQVSVRAFNSAGLQVVAVGSGVTAQDKLDIAAEVRTNLTTELARVDVNTSSRLAEASYTSPPSATDNSTEVFSKLMDGYTFEEIMKLLSAVILGKVNGAGTGTEVFRNMADTKNRVIATVDTSGNRIAITRDAT